MTTKELYNAILYKNLSLETAEELLNLRNRCMNEQNFEYYYLSTLHLIDIYIELLLYDEGITYALQDIANIDQVIYRKIYLSYLDRLIYLYIQKRNYRLAYNYVEAKVHLIDTNNRDEVNRWHLEMAYIYGEMNQKSKALTKFEAILENMPNEEILSHALSNMTKIYIDAKMTSEAEKTLSQCLEVTHDDEGRLYCDYLYALIFALRGKWRHAFELFKGIFLHGIKDKYLNIACDYLDLLIKQNKIKEINSLILEMKPLIEKNPNLELKKTFYHLGLESSLINKDNSEALVYLKKLKELAIDEKNSNDAFLIDSLDDEKLNVTHEAIYQISHKIEHLIQIMSFANNPNLRQLIMEYSKNLSAIIEFDEIHYALYEEIIPLNPSYEIISFYYKNNKLYEKQLRYDDLKDTIIETILAKHQEIYIDFRTYSVPIKNINTKVKYHNQEIDFLFALPFFEDNTMFFSVAYGAKYNDLGTPTNRLLLRTASLILEAKIRLYLQNTRYHFDLYKYTLLSNNLGAFIILHHKNAITLDDKLRKSFGFSSKAISLESYTEKMEEKEAKIYLQTDFSKEQSLFYSLINDDIKKDYREDIILHPEISDLSIGLVILRNQIKSQEEELNDYLETLKIKSKNPEFKFSFIRLKASFNDYEKVSKQFSIPIYYLGNDEFVIIWENEINQKSLERIIKGFEKNASIIRYPRDMVNISEILKYSQIALQEHITFFNEKDYQNYLYKISIQNLVKTSLNQKFELRLYPLKEKEKIIGYEVGSKFNGISETENIRTFLSNEILRIYDEKIFKQLLAYPTHSEYYLPLSLDIIKSEFVLKTRTLLNHFHLMIYEYSNDLIDIIEKLQIREIKVLLHYSIISQITYLEWRKLKIEGVIIDSNINTELRKKVLEIASESKWLIKPNYQIDNYEKYIVKTLPSLKGN